MSIFADITDDMHTVISESSVIHARYKTQLCRKLSGMKIRTVGDIISHIPIAYEHRDEITPLAQAVQRKEKVLIRAYVTSNAHIRLRSRGTMLKVMVQDDSAQAALHCYGRDFLQNVLIVGSEVFVWGKFALSYGEIASSNFEVITQPARRNTIIARYGLSGSGISQAMFSLCVKIALDTVVISDLRQQTNQQTNFDAMNRAKACYLIHFPKKSEDIQCARNYLALDEVVLFQLAMKYTRKKSDEVFSRTIGRNANEKAYQQNGQLGEHARQLIQTFVKSLPFTLTQGQISVIHEIIEDMRIPRPMRRIVQGDVGSGKTVVALCCALAIIATKGQVCFAVPSEALALQHYATMQKFFVQIRVHVALITGSTSVSERKKICKRLVCGEIDCIVGTHALYSKDVIFQNMQLVIIDEQHRFGIMQRNALLDKGKNAHALLMSATPIPRSFALTLYSGMDISTLTEKPVLQTRIKTKLILHEKSDKIYPHIKQKLDAREQAFFVFPNIETEDSGEEKPDSLFGQQKITQENVFSRQSGMVSAEGMYSTIAEALAPHEVALLHSKIVPKRREEILRKFLCGEIAALVSTTIIEIGIDVPQATTMCIFDAQNFGLATLHQLRGRVGRGAKAGEALLLYRMPLSNAAKERLKIIYEHDDGFFIAERDLELRGPGDIHQLGTRQSGSVLFMFFDMVEHRDVIALANEIATRIICEDPLLQDIKNRRFAHHISMSAEELV